MKQILLIGTRGNVRRTVCKRWKKSRLILLFFLLFKPVYFFLKKVVLHKTTTTETKKCRSKRLIIWPNTKKMWHTKRHVLPTITVFKSRLLLIPQRPTTQTLLTSKRLKHHSTIKQLMMIAEIFACTSRSFTRQATDFLSK